VSEPLFPPFEAVVDQFRVAGGMTITAIRSPRKLAEEFKAAFPTETTRDLRYLGAPVEVVDTQDFVSVRGTTVAGHEFEYPEPEREIVSGAHGR
jgi:hypothetical protein